MILRTLCCSVLLLAGCGGQAPTPDPSADTPAADSAASAEPAVTAADLPEPALPALDPGQYEWHGRWNGEPFWARLGPHDPQFGGRVLKLVYTQPQPEALDGTQLAPHPWLLLGEDLAISGWLERSRLSLAEYRDDAEPPGYAVVQETERRVGDDVFSDQRRSAVSGPRGWDRRLAPLLLSLLWRAESAGAVTVYDLMARDPAPSSLRWQGAEIVLGERSWRAEADDDGRLRRLLEPGGALLLEVEEHLPLLPPDEALERERAFVEALQGD